MDFADRIQAVNANLKADGVRCTIEQRKDSLFVRAVLPPKPGRKDPKRRQQRIPLGCKATIAGLTMAERKARTIYSHLQIGRFDWRDWIETPAQPGEQRKVADWIKAYESQYWDQKKKTDSTQSTWNKDYIAAFKKLPAEQILTLELMLETIRQTEPDSKTRQRVCDRLASLAKFAGLGGIESIKAMRGDYSPQAVRPRDLPSDEEIIEFYYQASHPGWKWVYGMMAAYGLRPHEVFRLDMERFPTIFVKPETKTGKATGGRFVYPLPPEWVDLWNLQERILPDFTFPVEEMSNAKLSTKVSKRFYSWARRKAGGETLTALDLRHCYARRWFELGAEPSYAAVLMGHSEDIHREVYRAWISEDYYARRYQQFLEKRDRV